MKIAVQAMGTQAKEIIAAFERGRRDAEARRGYGGNYRDRDKQAAYSRGFYWKVGR